MTEYKVVLLLIIMPPVLQWKRVLIRGVASLEGNNLVVFYEIMKYFIKENSIIEH